MRIFSIVMFTLVVFLASCKPRDMDIFNTIKNGDIKKTKELVSNGKMLNAREAETKMTPLIAAIIYRKTEIAVMLIKLGADISLTSDDNMTPFSWAACVNNLEVLKCLYKCHPDVDINHVDDYTTTPLILATKKNHAETVIWLLTLSSVDPNIQTKNGITSLGQAAYWGNLDMVKALIKNGANVNFINVKGQTILDFALERLKDDDWPEENKIKFKEVIKYLKAHGAKTAVEIKVKKRLSEGPSERENE